MMIPSCLRVVYIIMDEERQRKAEMDKRPYLKTFAEFKKALSSDLELRSLIRSYRLTAEICVKYVIFNDDYSSCVEDSYIDNRDILQHQPHLTREDLENVEEEEEED
jgi:hypothetical protein